MDATVMDATVMEMDATVMEMDATVMDATVMDATVMDVVLREEDEAGDFPFYLGPANSSHVIYPQPVQ
ncbi:hypothetical protein E2P81_ATG10775 [Venturia nashicola]|nr:hypothetical protein E2P81_ATG10775 [Venturia nashicola]